MRGDRRFCIADGMMNSLEEFSLEALSGF
jgi:hypothetical protein